MSLGNAFSTHTKCTKVQVKVHQVKISFWHLHYCHLLSIFCSTFPLLKLVFVSRCIWNWNLAHEPEFVKEGLYIWAWFGWLVRRAYKAGRGAYKPLLWASHCATNGGGHISIVPPTGWSPPTILPFTALSSPYCSAVQQQHILGVSLFELFKIEYMLYKTWFVICYCSCFIVSEVMLGHTIEFIIACKKLMLSDKTDTC